MMKRASRTGAGRFLVLGLAVALLAAQPASAEKLADIFGNLYGGDGIVLADPPNGHDARFTPPSNSKFDDLAQSLAGGLGLFSTGQAVASFTFDPAQAIFVRSEDTLGPLVAERPEGVLRSNEDRLPGRT